MTDMLKEAVPAILAGLVLMLVPSVIKPVVNFFSTDSSDSKLIYTYRVIPGSSSPTIIWLRVLNAGSKSIEGVKIWINGMPKMWEADFQVERIAAEDLRSCRDATKAPPTKWSEDADNYCVTIPSVMADSAISIAAKIPVAEHGPIPFSEIGTTMEGEEEPIKGTQVTLDSIVKTENEMKRKEQQLERNVKIHKSLFHKS